MRTFSLLLSFVLCGVCLGAEEKPASRQQGKEPSYEGKTASEWVAIIAKDRGPEFQLYAPAAFGHMGSDAVPTLIEFLKHKDGQFRSAAAVALGMIGREAKAAVPTIVAVLKDENKCVRGAAAVGLGGIGPEVKG